MTDIERIKADVERRYEYWRIKEHNAHSVESETRMSECQHLLLLINSVIQEQKLSNVDRTRKNFKEQEHYGNTTTTKH